MNLNELLKNFRIKNNMTQEQLAKKIHVSHQTVSKWEQGINTPSIDNLLILSDLYNISLDELIRGGNYLKKPFVMGKKNSPNRIIFTVIILVIFSLLIIGMWNQSFILAPFIFIFGIFFILPIIIDDYWILEKQGISIQMYPTSTSKKIKKIVTNLITSEKSIQFIPYNEFEKFEIVYLNRERFSPFDYSLDNFFTRITTTHGEKYDLQVTPTVVQFLPQINSYLTKKDIPILDNDNIIDAIVKKENLFEYMHE